MAERPRAWATWRAAAILGLVPLVVLLLLGSSVPDPAQLSLEDLRDLRVERPVAMAIATRLPLGRILTSPWLIALPAFLAAAILWNLSERLRERRRRRRPANAPFRAQHEWRSGAPPEREAERLERRLRRGAWRTSRAPLPGGGWAVEAHRGELGFWGSIAFHLGLVASLAAVVVTVLAQWNGSLSLVEGQQVALDDPGAVQLVRRGALAPGLPHVLLGLTGFETRFQGDRFPVDYRADLQTLDEEGRLRTAQVHVNGPVTISGQRLFLQRYGVAPVFEIRKGERLLKRAPLVLSVLEGREDQFDLPGEPVAFSARYLPDAVAAGGRAETRSQAPRNPAFVLTPLTPDRTAQAGPTVLLRQGQAVEVAGYQLAFPELRHWVELGVDRDPGTPLLFAALVMASLGLALRFWDHEREVRLQLLPDGGGTRLAAAGRSRYFPALMARELAALEERK